VTPDESFRATMVARNPDGEVVTAIVTKKGLGRDSRMWLTLDGGWRTTLVMTPAQTDELTGLLKAARDAA
jgi:biotin-(acetyl-CoA carboxylase) ligase